MEAPIATRTTRPPRTDLAGSARRLSGVVVAGLVAGAGIGGVGGRLAMLVLRLTSSDALHGVESDDGFVIGRVSGATAFLLVATGMLGVLGSLGYFSVRSWIPPAARAAWTGLFGGAVGGAAVLHADGIDFNLLRPLWLAVALFVALPAAYGVAMSRLVERALRRDAAERPVGGRLWPVGLAPLVGFAFLGPPGILLLVALAATWGLRRLRPDVATRWRSRVAVLAGRAVLLTVLAALVALTIRNAAAIL